MKEDGRESESEKSIQKELFNAVESGSAEEVKKAIQSGANVNQLNQNQGSALLIAVKYGDTDVVNLLLEAGHQGEFKDLALKFAARRGYEDIVSLLLKNGDNVDPNLKWKENAMIEAAYSGHEGTLRILLENGVDPNFINEGNTALHKILRTKKSKEKMKAVASTLLKYGANPTAKTPSGKTPLDLLEANNKVIYPDLVEVILSTLIEIRFHKALMELFGQGISIDAKDRNGNTLLHKAAMMNDISLQNQLIERGANINATNNSGNTPLIEAILSGKVESAQDLIEKGAKIHILNNENKNAYNIASLQKYTVIATELYTLGRAKAFKKFHI